MSVTDSINKFCTYFERQLIVITNLDVDWNKLPGSAIEDYQVRFYRKSLLVGGLDTLAGIRFPKKHYPELSQRNRERFIRFIKEFGRWPGGELVSLPFLNDQIIKIELSGTAIGSHVSAGVENFDIAEGNLPISKIDKPAQDLLILAKNKKEKETIMDQQHYALLYRYRNYLVHEWREPGSAMEINSLANEPYYHRYIKDPSWHLVYPMQLFTDMFSNTVAGFKQYLLDKSIDPYDFVEDTSRW